MTRRALPIILTVLAAGPALAQPEVRLEAQQARMAATVTGANIDAAASRWSLAQLDRDRAIAVQADDVRAYRDSDEPIALVVLVEGHTLFIGNTTYEKDPIYRAAGVHQHLGAVLEALREVGPKGSLGAVVTYDQGAKVRRAMGPLTALDATAIGVESDYRDNLTRDLAEGVEMSLELLRSVTTPRKALIVIGDGADTNVTAAPARLDRLKQECARDGIELYGIKYVVMPGDEPSIDALMPVETASQAKLLPEHAQRIARRIDDRIEIGFPAKRFAADGCAHDYELRLDGTPFPSGGAPIAMAAAPGGCRPADAQGTRTWLVAVIVSGALLLALGGLLLARRSARARSTAVSA